VQNPGQLQICNKLRITILYRQKNLIKSYKSIKINKILNLKQNVRKNFKALTGKLILKEQEKNNSGKKLITRAWEILHLHVFSEYTKKLLDKLYITVKM